MAANTSFKVQCPSCEAMVPIRDPNLVGKKIDCPKCKYRFVVEDPDADARPVKAKKKPKPKKGGSNVVLIGSVLGALAVAVLGVGGWWLFSGDTPKPVPVASANPNPAPAPAATQPNPDNPPPAPENPNQPTPDSPTPTPTPTPAAAAPQPPIKLTGNDYTNALPDDSQSVISVHIDRLARNSTLGTQAFESRVGFKSETFKNRLGIGLEEMVRLVRGENLEQNWAFNVLRTTRPFKFEELKNPLGLTKGPKSPINGRDYYRTAPNEILDHLSSILQSELETKDLKEAQKAKKSNLTPLALAFIDPTTLVFANEGVLEEFLKNDGKWELRTKLTPGGAPAGDAPAGDPAPQGRRGREGAGGAGENPPPEGEGAGPQFTNRATYLTVDPVLKAEMDRFEGGDKKVILAIAVRPQSNEKILQRIRTATGLPITPGGMAGLGLVLNEFDNSRFAAQISADMFRENDAKAFEEAIKRVMPVAGRLLSLFLGGLKIDVEGGSGTDPDAGPGGGRGGPTGGGVGVRPGGPEGPGGGFEDPNAPGAPGGGGDGPKSKIALSRRNRAVSFDVDLNFNKEAYERVYNLTEGVIVRMKGLVDMAGGVPRWNELAAATRLQVDKDEKKLFPRGTYSRESGLGDRLSRTWAPNHRVSWLVSLLPYLGQEDLYNSIDTKKSWRDEENLKRGQILIPQFLNPLYPRPAWRANVPSLGARDQGATHVVGVAGVGEDAADYRYDDPATKKKLGMVGYNRRVGPKDVTDGLSNTVYMIQVKPDLPRPWIAGGGATVTGIPEKDSIKPFVTLLANGKRGAVVLMADGSVRVVSDTISDEVFKSLVTIQGGEETADLEKNAPRWTPPKASEMKTDDK
jgi:hypothetical protein